MLIKMRTVTVHEIPRTVTANSERIFLRELQPYVATERPRLVLDCSRLATMNSVAIHLLLCCLEEAMKRNGDVKLAALRPEARATLDFTGVSRLFEMYATTAEAVGSFQRRAAVSKGSLFGGAGLGQESESVA